MMPNLYVRALGTRELIETIEVTQVSQVQKVMLGILRNMNMDRYYLDDSEFGEQERPKHWIPKLIPLSLWRREDDGKWEVGFWDGNTWENDGSAPMTAAEAQKRAAWLNEQEPKP